MKLPCDPKLKELARMLRNQSTLSEILLWQHLSHGQRRGFDFHRQKPIDRYIVDFFSHQLMLAVEIDGSSHKLKGKEDDLRQSRLESLGIRFLRFSDHEVKRNLEGVVQAIDLGIEAHASRHQTTHPGAPRHPS